jgi:hypothetical protein
MGKAFTDEREKVNYYERNFPNLKVSLDLTWRERMRRKKG